MGDFVGVLSGDLASWMIWILAILLGRLASATETQHAPIINS